MAAAARLAPGPRLVKLPSSSPVAPPAAPALARKAWPDGKISVSFPEGYDPVTRSFSSPPAATATSAAATSAPSAAAPAAGDSTEAELLRRRALRFAPAAAPAPPAPAPAGGEDYASLYAARAAEQAALREAFRANKRAKGCAEAAAAAAAVRQPPGAGAGPARLGATAAACGDGGGAVLSLAELRARRGQQ